MKYLAILLQCVASLNPQHRLVQVWDQITFYDMATGIEAGSFNMTTFPYIDGVRRVYIVVQNQFDPGRVHVLREKHHLL